MNTYIALIHPPEGGSSWGITFPDVPGCVSAGDSFEEVLTGGREALSSHLALSAAEGDPVPPARSFETLRADPDLAEDF